MCNSILWEVFAIKALLVIDMQQDYVGESRNKKRFPYDALTLIHAVNAEIERHLQDASEIIYVRNRFKLQGSASQLASGLIVVSDFMFEKQAASCFTNEALAQHLKANGIDEVELVGVDGNFCVGKSALHGRKMGLSVSLRLSAVGVADPGKFERTRLALLGAGVSLID